MTTSDTAFRSFHHRLTRTIGEGIVLGFEWFGGAYIEVCRRQSFGSPGEVINVWDAAHGKPTIERTEEAMARYVDAWIETYPRSSLIHDVTENWRR